MTTTPTPDELKAVLERARAASAPPPPAPIDVAISPQVDGGPLNDQVVPEAAKAEPTDAELDAALISASQTPVGPVSSQLVPVIPTEPMQTAIDVPKPVAKALAVDIGANQILGSAGSLALQEAMNAVIKRASGPVFKVAALQSGYTVEFGALNFEETARLQASAVDAHAARVKLLRVVHGRMISLSCGPIRFEDWLKITAQGDYDTLLYGLYAATYPGENEFDVRCRHCGHENKIRSDVGALARIEGSGVMDEIKQLLDPNANYKGAIQKSLVGRRVQRQLPTTGIVAEVTNPSLQDYLDGVQWFVQNQDRATGELPANLAGNETIRTLVMYIPRALVQVPGSQQFLEVKGAQQIHNMIGKLPRADGQALVDAVDAEVRDLSISYQLPSFNCGGCGKRNEDLVLDFENLLFFKLREKA
jgi:hypothetical protein